MNSFIRFCLYFGRNPVPSDQNTLKCYVAFLARSLNPNSIPGYLNIIRIMHVSAGFPNPLQNNWEVNMVKKGVSRKLGRPPRQKLPITVHILLGILKNLDLSSNFDLAFWCACLICFYGLFRKNTLLPSCASDKSSAFLIRGDVSKLTLSSFHILVRQTKTIQFGQRVLSIPFVACVDARLCPVSALIRHLAGSPLARDFPLFSYKIGDRILCLSHTVFVKRLKVILGTLGFPASEYSGHSFRRGGCTFCFRAGLSLTEIKLRGDWKTQAFERYLHVPASTVFHGAYVMSEFVAVILSK